MSLFILDTDHLTLLRQAHSAVVTRAVLVPRDELATTVITFEEQVSGWYTAVRKARDAEKLARAYAGLHEVAQTARVIRILPFSREAVALYLDLKKQHPRLGKMDLALPPSLCTTTPRWSLVTGKTSSRSLVWPSRIGPDDSPATSENQTGVMMAVCQ